MRFFKQPPHANEPASKFQFVGEKVPFGEAFREVSRGVSKYKQTQYQAKGAHPIVDQGKEGIAGYSDDEDGLFTDVPAIVFGDHTRNVKYVEEPFFIGADGVKILKPALSTNARYWYHALRAAKIENLGYSRHFKLLKEKTFVNQSLEEQLRICSNLDAILGYIRLMQAQQAKLDQLVKSRFVEMFGRHRLGSCSMGDLLSGIVSGTNVGGQQRLLKKDEYAVLKISSVTQGVFNPDEYKVVDDVSGIRMIHPRKGDLLFSRANTREMIGATAIVDCDYDQLFLPDKLWRLELRDGVEAVFVKHLLSSPAVRSEVSKTSTGTSGSMKNISMTKFRGIPAFLPPLSLQQEFADFVAKVDKPRFVAQQQMEKLQMLYDSLAQDYFG